MYEWVLVETIDSTPATHSQHHLVDLANRAQVRSADVQRLGSLVSIRAVSAENRWDCFEEDSQVKTK